MPRTIWIDSHYTTDVASGAGLAFSLIGAHGTELRLEQLTLMRTILRLDLAPAVMDAGEGSQTFDLGLGIASQEAVALGVTALPDPQDPENFPPRGWIFKARYRVWATAADRAVVVWREIDKDIRARRKLDNGEPYVMYANTASEGTAFTVRVTGIIRQLWLVR